VIAAFWSGYRQVRQPDGLDDELNERTAGFAGWHLLDRLLAAAHQSVRLKPVTPAAAGIGRAIMRAPRKSAETIGLAGIQIGYRAKVVSRPDMLPRWDGLVVYLAGRDLEAAGRVAAAAGGIRGIGGQVSVFAKPIAHGVAIAWEPADRRPGMRGLSFGEHRSAALADGLVWHGKQRDDRAPVAGFVRSRSSARPSTRKTLRRIYSPRGEHHSARTVITQLGFPQLKLRMAG
jgi:HopA1 effector protein family